MIWRPSFAQNSTDPKLLLFAKKVLQLEVSGKMSLFSINVHSSKRSANTESYDGNSDGDEIPWVSIFLQITKVIIIGGVMVYVVQKTSTMIQSILDGSLSSKASLAAMKKALAVRLKRPEVETMEFTKHEMNLLADIIGPDEITVSFKDIGGMDAELEDVKDNVVLPMQLWNRFRRMNVYGNKSAAKTATNVTKEGEKDAHQQQQQEDEVDDDLMDLGLASCPTGVLLYGQPGTGKSLTAKAIAKGEVELMQARCGMCNAELSSSLS